MVTGTPYSQLYMINSKSFTKNSLWVKNFFVTLRSKQTKGVSPTRPAPGEFP